MPQFVKYSISKMNGNAVDFNVLLICFIYFNIHPVVVDPLYSFLNYESLCRERRIRYAVQETVYMCKSTLFFSRNFISMLKKLLC